MEGDFVVPLQPAAADELVVELYNHQYQKPQVTQELKDSFDEFLPKTDPHSLSVLIVGGRTGWTSQLLAPYAKHIDIVETEPFLEALKARFVRKQAINYSFTTEGNIGTNERLEAPKDFKRGVRIISLNQFVVLAATAPTYDVILLQNLFKVNEFNVLREMLPLQHSKLITMLVPGKAMALGLFETLCVLEKEVIPDWYSILGCHHIQNERALTGRRRQLVLWQVYGWDRKPKGQSKLNNDQIRKFFEINSSPAIELKGMALYESQELVNMYLQFHFGEEEVLGLKNYPLICANRCVDFAQSNAVTGRALDIGCAVGRTTIELADYFSEAIGIDLSDAFIKAANQTLQKDFVNKKPKVKFFVGDACKMDRSLGKFELIFGGNLIDRLYDPEAFLVHVAEFMNPEGLLVLSSPYTWLLDYTPLQKWIGGYVKDGKSVTTQEGLNKILSKHGFKQARPDEDIRFALRENHWVLQDTLANLTYWRKNA